MFSKICSPLHEHELQEADPMIVYGSFAGHWKCDHCGAENNSSSHPFHCRQCSFDLCYSCVYSNINEDYSVHRHPLYYVETSRLYYQNQNGLWRCAVCKKTSHTLRETFSFHCPTCPDFDICRKCYVPWQHPIHRHVLRLVDTSLIYTVSGGSWVCDVCGHPSRPFEKFSRHCEECEFDVCQECFKPQNTPLHQHPLYKANSHDVYAQFNGGWRCDNCRSVHNNPLDHFSWHCPECEYDLCQDCVGGVIEAADQTGPSPALISRTRGFQTHSALFSRQPEENPWLTRDRVTTAESESNAASMALITEKGKALAFPEDTDDNSKCIICMEQPKNATIIHGDTGHCCCCLQCAQVLKLRGDPCPICRAPIDHVIRQFNA